MSSLKKSGLDQRNVYIYLILYSTVVSCSIFWLNKTVLKIMCVFSILTISVLALLIFNQNGNYLTPAFLHTAVSNFLLKQDWLNYCLLFRTYLFGQIVEWMNEWMIWMFSRFEIFDLMEHLFFI